jgi:hypothetical protein
MKTIFWLSCYDLEIFCVCITVGLGCCTIQKVAAKEPLVQHIVLRRIYLLLLLGHAVLYVRQATGSVSNYVLVLARCGQSC